MLRIDTVCRSIECTQCNVMYGILDITNGLVQLQKILYILYDIRMESFDTIEAVAKLHRIPRLRRLDAVCEDFEDL